MWIIIISFCAVYDGGTKCASFIPPRMFHSEVECARQKPTARGGVIDAIDSLDGTPILIKIQCQDLGASA